MRQNQLHLAPVARQQVVPGGLLGLSLCLSPSPEPVLGNHRRKEPKKVPSNRRLTCSQPHLFPGGRSFWALSAGCSSLGSQPKALTKGGEVEGQARVGTLAPESDAVHGVLHGRPAPGREGAPVTRGVCVAPR